MINRHERQGRGEGAARQYVQYTHSSSADQIRPVHRVGTIPGDIPGEVATHTNKVKRGTNSPSPPPGPEKCGLSHQIHVTYASLQGV